MIQVKLIYFKQSGKYYSEGEVGFPDGTAHYQIIQKLIEGLNAGRWPGLQVPDDFNILVTGTDDKGDIVPHVILASQLRIFQPPSLSRPPIGRTLASAMSDFTPEFLTLEDGRRFRVVPE